MTAVARAGDSHAGSAWPQLPQDIDTSFIRLLEIDAGTTRSISCSLSVFPLESAPAFHALSYCWGTDTAEQVITCNGHSIRIRLNLYEALLQLRDLGYTCLWIDAICINQSDVKEKGRQVNLMGQIYATAEATLVWLGPARDDQEQAMTLLTQLSRAYDEHQEVFIERSAPNTSMSEEMLLEVGLPNWPEVALEPLFHLFLLPWFNRGWVVQEFILARDVLFVWGEMTIPWQRLGSAFSALRHIPSWRYWLSLNHSAIYRIHSICGSRFTVQDPVACNDFDILREFMSHRKSICSNEVDKIFCMLSVFTRFVEANGGRLSSRPNYDLTVEQVFIAFAFDVLHQTENLDMLCLLRPADVSQKQLPSWVPDFGTSNQRTDLYTRSLGVPFASSGNLSLTSLGARYTKFRGTSLALSVQVLDEIVATSGCILDPLHLDPQSHSLIKNEPALSAIGQVLRSRLETCPRQGNYVNGETNQAVFWHVIYVSTDARHSVTRAACETDDMISLERTIINLSGTVTGESDGTAVVTKRDMASLDGWGVGYLIGLWRLDDAMKMARTSRGYYCKVPWLTEVGDSIILCAGGRTPFAARQREGAGEARYQVLGGCYVHGIMHGEAWDPKNTKEWWFD